MKPIYKKYFKTIGLMWSGWFVVLMLVYLLAVGPKMRMRHRLAQEAAAKQQIFLSAYEAAQEGTKARLSAELEDLRSRLGDFVIDTGDSSDLTFDISQIAQEKKVGSFSIRGKKGHVETEIPDCEQIEENYVSIDFIAQFNQFAAFLNSLERHRPVVFVEGFTISQSKKEQPGHDVNMQLAVFVRKPQDGESSDAI